MPTVPTTCDALPDEVGDGTVTNSAAVLRRLNLPAELLDAGREALTLALRIDEDARRLYELSRYHHPAATAAAVEAGRTVDDPDDRENLEIDAGWYSGRFPVHALTLSASRILKATSDGPMGKSLVDDEVRTFREEREQAADVLALIHAEACPPAIIEVDGVPTPVPNRRRVAAALTDALAVYCAGQRLAAEYETMQSTYIAPVWDRVGEDATPGHPAVTLDESTGVHLLYRILRDAAAAIGDGLDGAQYEPAAGHLAYDAATDAVTSFLAGE